MGDASKEPFDVDEPLDQLLHRSPRSDVDADRLDRLAGQWQSISGRRVRVRAGVTIMIGLTITVGSYLAFRAEPFQRMIVQPAETPRQPPELEEAVVQRESTSPAREETAVAADGVYDQLICVAVERTIRERKRGRQLLAPEPRLETPPELEGPDASIDELVALAASRLADKEPYDDLVAQVKEEWSEQALLEWIQAAGDAVSIDAALHLLSHVVTKRSIPMLMRLRETHGDSATRLIARVAEPDQLFRLAREERDDSLGQELAATLLQHPEPRAVYLFLQLVDDRATSAMALGTVATVEELPTDLLLQCLAAPSRKVRLTAAMVLGQSRDANLSAQLVQLLGGTRTRRAAMVALVASRDDWARQFVDQASRDVYLAASVHAAQSVVNSFRLEG